MITTKDKNKPGRKHNHLTLSKFGHDPAIARLMNQPGNKKKKRN